MSLLSYDDSIYDDEEDRERRQRLYDDLDYLTSDEYNDTSTAEAYQPLTITPSVEVVPEEPDNGMEKDWFTDFVNSIEEAKANAKSGKHGSVYGAGDDMFGKKKKKKKKKKDGEPTDYTKEFEVENQLYSNLLRDATKFTDALQAEYDSITGKKATGRGMSKNLQDLVANITSSRQLSMSLIDKRVNLKKLAAELNWKEKKELGLSLDSENLGQYGSEFLKKLIDDRQMLFNGGSEYIMDADDSMVDSLLDENMDMGEINTEEYGVDDRTPEAEAYLKYENRNVTTYVSINSSDTDDYYYFAEDEDGNELPDYPLPISNISSINRSTGIASDQYGQKFKIVWR